MSLDNLTHSEFSKWYLLGQAVRRGVGARVPVAYLYNGVRLPGLPDSVGGGFAYIGEWSPTSYVLVLINEPAVVTSTSLGNFVGPYIGGTHYGIVDGEWVPIAPIASSVNLVWCNFDAYHGEYSNEPAGTLFMAASDPIPVYE